MKVISSTKSVFWDVDETLVFSSSEYQSVRSGTCVNIRGRIFKVHEAHVQQIMDFKARGHLVVVWSAGGHEWAANVVQALGLEPHVDYTMSKPDWVFDNAPVTHWMPEHIRCYTPITGYDAK